MLRILGVMLFCFIFALGIVFLRTIITKKGRDISVLQNKIEIKESTNQYLKFEILQLSNPEKINNIAQNKLNMTIIKPHKIVVLPEK